MTMQAIASVSLDSNYSPRIELLFWGTKILYRPQGQYKLEIILTSQDELMIQLLSI